MCRGKKPRNYWRFSFSEHSNKRLLAVVNHKLNFQEQNKYYLTKGREETEYPNKIVLCNSSISAKTNS